MSTTMLNVRMPIELKTSADNVFKKNGITATSAIKSLYEQVSKTQEIPCWIPDNKSKEIERKRILLREIADTINESANCKKKSKRSTESSSKIKQEPITLDQVKSKRLSRYTFSVDGEQV